VRLGSLDGGGIQPRGVAGGQCGGVAGRGAGGREGEQAQRDAGELRGVVVFGGGGSRDRLGGARGAGGVDGAGPAAAQRHHGRPALGPEPHARGARHRRLRRRGVPLERPHPPRGPPAPPPRPGVAASPRGGAQLLPLLPQPLHGLRHPHRSPPPQAQHKSPSPSPNSPPITCIQISDFRFRSQKLTGLWVFAILE
jgi:hypothetical protein